MPLCLYECLTAVGLQSHFARFTSLGVHQAAHLSDLTVEDYPFLGIRSMEDRTRLFNLVQMLKTLNLKNEDADDDTDAEDTDHERVAAVSKLNAPNPPKPPHVRRRLDFSCETSDHRLNLFFSCPDKPVHVCASHIRNIVPCQGRASAIPVQVDTGSGCKEKNHHRLHFHRRISRKVVGQKGRNGILRRENFCSDIKNNVHTEHNTKPTPVYESKRTTGYNYGLPLTSPPVPDNKQPGGQRISVCLRKRPLTKAERRRGEADVVTTQSGECVIVDESKEAVDLSHYKLQHRFYFDQVFGEESSNVEVYQRTAYPLVQHMLNGGKATCFAYGQTGAGKTHTMLGSPVRPGLYALAVLDIFAYLSTPDMHSPLLVHVSFFEIYCGQLYDLLDHRKRLFAREDGQKVVHIVGLRDVRVDSVGSLLEVISRGTEERTQGMSGVNPVSSRSHALLQIQLRDADQHIAGRMWFVDLAGSEKASDTKEPNRQSRMEGAEINQSLLALKECIRSLDQEQSHTPFRQSKLTQVLKDSFVGDSMTCMIANISPGHLATEHTLNTLRYADRVKELGGQLGLRGRRRGKPTHSSKCNLSNSSSRTNVVGTRGKGPPKKPKSGGQTPIFGVPTPTTRLTMEGSILCSTPKGGRQEGETSPSARKSIGLEKITAVRGLLGMGDSRDRGGGRESERRESNGVTGSLDKSDKKSVMAATDEQILLKEVQKKSGFNHNKKDNHQITWKEESKEERSWMEEERRVKSSRDTSVSDLINQDMDEVLHAYRGKSGCNNQMLSFFPSGEICFPTETSPSHSRNKDEVGQCGSASLGEKLRVSRGETEAKLGPHSGKQENRSQKETGEGVRREGWRPSGIEGATTLETERANRNTGAMPAEALVVDGVWSTEDREGADGCGLPSIQRNLDITLLNHPLAESSRQRAPAERPLSPACEHTDVVLTPCKLRDPSLGFNHTRSSLNIGPLPLQNAPHGVPSIRNKEKQPWFAAHAFRTDYLSLLPTPGVVIRYQLSPFAYIICISVK
ncbi:kinesin-like protein KIF24 isoform X3 [Pungitius pungitius]|uniref:kinesin-like protein KIF24 isoform X3 n=1 Tax=Pungitius pungitius TaxID=134920 RepID=UPI002E145D05